MRAIRAGAALAAQTGVPHAELLVRFAQAAVARDEEALRALRPKLVDALGPDGLLEAAGVAANFQRMVRIADGTGIPQDAPVRVLAGDVVDELSLREFPSSANTPRSGFLLKIAARLIGPLAPRIMGRVARRMKASGPAS